jgi:hypothetical protein
MGLNLNRRRQNELRNGVNASPGFCGVFAAVPEAVPEAIPAAAGDAALAGE